MSPLELRSICPDQDIVSPSPIRPGAPRRTRRPSPGCPLLRNLGTQLNTRPRLRRSSVGRGTTQDGHLRVDLVVGRGLAAEGPHARPHVAGEDSPFVRFSSGALEAGRPGHGASHSSAISRTQTSPRGALTPKPTTLRWAETPLRQEQVS